LVFLNEEDHHNFRFGQTIGHILQILLGMHPYCGILLLDLLDIKYEVRE
jgi:hypothetical protein